MATEQALLPYQKRAIQVMRESIEQGHAVWPAPTERSRIGIVCSYIADETGRRADARFLVMCGDPNQVSATVAEIRGHGIDIAEGTPQSWKPYGQPPDHTVIAASPMLISRRVRTLEPRGRTLITLPGKLDGSRHQRRVLKNFPGPIIRVTKPPQRAPAGR